MRANANGGVRIVEDASCGAPDLEEVTRRYGVRPSSFAVYYDRSGIAKTEMHFDPPARPFTPTLPGRFQPPIGPSLAEALQDFGSATLSGMRSQLRNMQMIRDAYDMGATVRSNAKPGRWTCGRCMLDWPDDSPVCLMCGNTATPRPVPPSSISIPTLPPPPVGEVSGVRVMVDGKVVGEGAPGTFFFMNGVNEGPTRQLSGVTIGYGHDVAEAAPAPAPVWGFGVAPDGLSVEDPALKLPPPPSAARPESFSESYATIQRLLREKREQDAAAATGRTYTHTFRVR